MEFTLCHLSLARNRDIEKEKWTRFNKKFNRLLAGPLQNTLCELGTISEKDRRSLHVCLPSCRLSLHRVEGRRYSVGFSLCCRRGQTRSKLDSCGRVANAAAHAEATLQGRQTVQLHADKLAADSVSFVDGGTSLAS